MATGALSARASGEPAGRSQAETRPRGLPRRMVTLIATRNLLHDRTRLAATLVGLVFAIVLINLQSGLLLGFLDTTAALVSHSRADLWIVAAGTRNVDQSIPLSERKLYQALAAPGVRAAERYTVEMALLKRPDGTSEGIMVVGFEVDGALGGPWNVVAGDMADLRVPYTIMVDELYRDKLGVRELGDVVEINGYRAKVVGFTRGIRSFTQAPYVFTSFENSLDYARLSEDETKYVLVDIDDGADPAWVRAWIEARLRDVDIHSTDEFAVATQAYWMITTGAGAALLAAAVLGLFVGVVIVSQTLYATTIDHLPEYATLRAMGADRRYLHGIILRQAVISALMGYAIALAISLAIVHLVRGGGPAVLLPWQVIATMLAVTVAMCCLAAIVSIRKVMRIDPGSVFR